MVTPSMGTEWILCTAPIAFAGAAGGNNSDSKGKLMAIRTLRMLCTDGDKTVAEWDTDQLTPQRLREIEMEFNSRIQEGFFAADVTGNRNILIKKFDPTAQILLIPRVHGG
jgi:hypothetical protein